MPFHEIVVTRDGITLAGARARNDEGECGSGVCIDSDQMAGCSRHTLTVRLDRVWTLDAQCIRRSGRAPHAVPGIPAVPGHEATLILIPF